MTYMAAHLAAWRNARIPMVGDQGSALIDRVGRASDEHVPSVRAWLEGR